MIELCVVMGIATVLMAMVLGLSRHVNEIVKNRHAQADLGEWHETLNDWFLKFGMYPDSSVPPFNSAIESNLFCLASSSATYQYRVRDSLGGINPQIPPFCALTSKPLHTTDPWGTPYIYQSATNSYVLFSCGPNGVHKLDNGTFLPKDAPNPPAAPNIDDVYFEP